MSAGVCPFPSVDAACKATIAAIQTGIPVARIELFDTLQVKASNAYSKLSLKETPTLFLEFHGSEAGVAEQAERFGEIAADLGGGPFALDDQGRGAHATCGRRATMPTGRMMALRPGARGFATDVCVPISRLAECVADTQADIAEMGLVAPIVGHVGDGNFHVGVLVMMDDKDEVARAERFLDRLVERAIAMDGTSTGEHGIGQGKMKYMEAEHGPGALDGHARGQAGDRSERPDESGQDRRPLRRGRLLYPHCGQDSEALSDGAARG